MPTARSYYGPDAHVTEIPGVDGSGVSPEMAALLSNEYAAYQQRRQPTQPLARYGAAPVGGSAPAAGTYSAPPRMTWQQRDAANQAAEAMRLDAQAHANGAPMRYSYPGGQTVLTQDVDHLNAYQRALYLPKESKWEAGGLSDGQQIKYASAIEAARAAEQRHNAGYAADLANPGMSSYERQQAESQRTQQARANAGYGQYR